MSHRPLEIAAFLDQHGWSDASAQAFDGDFSPRRYARLTHADGRTAILMDADADQKTPHFVRIAKILRDSAIAAPEIYAAAPEQGLVLLQDFGTRNIGALIDAGEKPEPYFLRAAETLATLHQNFNRADSLSLDLPLLNTNYFVPQAELFLDEYIPYAREREATEEERRDFRAAWHTVLRPIETMPQSLMLRDFITDNLMDLPDGSIGVLDFELAGIGSVAYDLASLCDEVRRDGAFRLLPHVIAHYRATLEKTGTPTSLSQADLTRACTILSAQRHTRTLGNVARTAIKRGQHKRLSYLQRMRQHLKQILNESYLIPVREWMENFEIGDS